MQCGLVLLMLSMKEYSTKLGDSFSLITAFSREGSQKVYVQHRLSEHAKEVHELISQGAYFYVCGDAARMAREVNTTLGNIIAKERGLTETQGEEMVKRLRSSGVYQVSPFITSIYSDIISIRSCPCDFFLLISADR